MKQQNRRPGHFRVRRPRPRDLARAPRLAFDGARPVDATAAAATTMTASVSTDVLLVDDGRVARAPRLTFVFDAHSRMILGWHVTT